jgi:hypothetical protein
MDIRLVLNMNLLERFLESHRSFMRLPLWVRLWVLLCLGGVNISAFFLTQFPIGYWAAWAAAFVFVINGAIILFQRGFSKLLALPHLIVWVPLLIYVIWRLSNHDVTWIEFSYGLALLMINGLSVLFDTVDTWRWFKGEREVA